MASVQPSGISSSLSWKEKKVYLETEFATRPQPRITTTASYQGEVIHKAEQPWQGGLKRQEDKEKIEALIKEQHAQAKVFVQNKIEEMLTKRLTKPLPKFWEGISKLEGIENVLGFNREGKLLFQEKQDQSTQFERIIQSITSTIQLANFLSGVSKLENLTRSNIQTEDFKVVLFQRKDNFFAVHLSKDKTPEELIPRIEEMIA